MTSIPVNDLILRATATNAPFRFVLIDLTHISNAIGAQHGARAHCLSLLAEASIASLLLSSGLKFPGTISMQVGFSGDLSMVQADSTPMGLVRAMIPFEEIQKAGDFELLLSPQRIKVRKLNEKAKLVQESIVDAASTSMSANLSAYMLQSEQTKSGVGIHSRTNDKDDRKLDYAIGFLVEAYPGADEKQLNIMDMVIRDLPPMQNFMTADGFQLKGLLDQLSGPFETEIIREITPNAYCPCSKVRTLENISTLPSKELNDLIQEGDDLEVTCDFCRATYTVTLLELREILDQRG